MRTRSCEQHRHVLLPKDIEALLPKPQRLLSETEWRGIGVQQSRGWVHYAIHRPEPHMCVLVSWKANSPKPPHPHSMLFRRPLNYGQPNQVVPPQAQPNGVQAQ